MSHFEERQYFAQPCIHEECGSCSIYSERYDVCRAYRCALLERYQAGKVTLEDAQLHVSTAFSLRDAVAAADPLAALYAERKHIRAQLASKLKNDRKEGLKATAARLLNIIALDLYVERWFLDKNAEKEA